jgi:hypothetical protein
MEVKKFQVFIVKENSPAFMAIKKSFGERRLKNGKILPVSDEEFKSFHEDIIQLEIQKGGST